MSGDRVYRVTVRGRFHALTDEALRYLTQAQPEHEIFKSAYTAEGTFTYDARIAFFNLRYEVRSEDDASASAIARREAELFLRTMKFGYQPQHLTVDVVDASKIWDDVDRTRRP